MSSRIFHDLMIHGPRRIMVEGSFAPNGSSAISAASNKGLGWSVAYTSTGLYTLTFQDSFVDLESITVSLQLASGDDKALQLGTWTASAKTLEIRCWDTSAAAVADIAADANNRINFQAIFRDTGAR